MDLSCSENMDEEIHLEALVVKREPDAEDSNAEDSDAEDSNAEDSDARDSDSEDSDAEDSDAEDSDVEAEADYRIVSYSDLIPLVYTTRLDDMLILNSNTSNLQPREVTAIILKESKPKLQTFPNIDSNRSCKKSYNTMKNKLKNIYHQNNINLETNDVKFELHEEPIEVDSIKCEAYEDPIDASQSTHYETDPFIKHEVLDEPIISACKYSELIKLCRPCSVVLPILSSDEVLKPNQTIVTSKANIIERVNDQKESQDVPEKIDSSSDEEPLITLKPDLRSKIESNDSELMYEVKTKKGLVKVCKPSYDLVIDPDYQKKLIASFQNRILADGAIEVTELYSKECSTYCYSRQGYLLEYYKENNEIPLKNKDALVSSSGTNNYVVKSCCWVQRDGMIQSLYPKVLLYSSLRFMRKPHTCPAGECSCCCQKKEGIFGKPDIELTDDSSSHVPLPFLKEAIEIEALENEIQSTIVKMNKEPRINRQDMLRNLLENPTTKLSVKNKGSISLIDQALMYKKPLPKKPIDNRRLLSSTLENSQSGVIVLRNFAADEREIFELNPDGELKSYLKLTCFNNTDRPDVKKLLQKTKQVNDVCCWFKRENIIIKLIKSKTLHHSAVKFMRTRHTCTGNQCNCCCEPAGAKEVTLTDITFPARPSYWPELLDKLKARPKPSTWLDNYAIEPTVSSISTPSTPTPVASSPPVRPRLLPKLPKLLPKMPAGNKARVQGTPVLRLDKRYIKPASFYAATTSTKPTPDEDCQFVGVTAAPTLGLQQNSTPIEIPNNITGVQGDDLAKEVNTLITSILERFKDVRLTINSDGKVAAALNTPVSSLTTVELKVLANILSYAQSQVNSLGLNTGMSLSNIINLKVGDPQTATSIDPTSIYKAFGDNVDVNNLSSGAHVNPPNNFLDSSTPNRHDMKDYFTKTMYMKSKEYTDSFTSLLATKSEAEHSDSSVPVIQNVFSLQEQDIKTGNQTSSATVFCRKPANQNQRPNASKVDTHKVNENSKKRTGTTDMEVTPPVTKKIRVLSPSKLSASPLNKINSMVNSVHEPLPATQTHALEVNGIRPEVPLLSNNNLRVMTVTAPVQPSRVTKPRIIRQNNFKAFTPQPSIVVTPLQVASLNDNIVEESPILGTPFSSASVSTATEDIEIQEVPIKIEQVFQEEDDCILGV